MALQENLQNPAETCTNVPTNSTEKANELVPEMGSPESRPECFRSTSHEVILVLTTMMAIMSSSLTNGMLTVISNAIAQSLDMTQGQISWLTAAPSLAGGSTLLLFGRLADLFGRKILFNSGLALFAIFMLAASFSQNPVTICVLNGFLGLVSALVITPAVGLLGSIYKRPSKRRNYAFACYSAGNPVGFFLGILCGGIATKVFNWQASYRFIAILHGTLTIIALFAVPKDTSAKEPFNAVALKRLDLVGVILIMGGVGLLTTALTLGGDRSWISATVLAPLLIAIALLVAFILWETKFDYPLVPMKIWTDRDFSLLVVMLMLGVMAFNSSIFWIALLYQRQGKFAIKVALYLIPMVVIGLIMNIFVGATLHKYSNKKLMAVGTTSYFIAFLLLAVQRSGASYFAYTFPALLLIPIGADVQFNVVNMYVMLSLPHNQQSVAGGIFQTVSRLCVTIGFGISTAIFTAVAKDPPRSGYYGNDPIAPYASAFWFSFCCSGVSLMMVPFLKIKTQGQISLGS